MFTPVQRWIIGIGLALLGLGVLVVPWRAAGYDTHPLGYGLIFWPPNHINAQIDMARFVIVEGFVILATAGGVVLAGRPRR